MKKYLLAAVCFILVLCMVSCNIIINKIPDQTTDTNSGETTDAETSYPHENMELAGLDEIVAYTEKQQIPVSTLRYFFMDQYSTFLNNYYYYLSYFGLDYTAPLHDQIYDESDGSTWYDHFLTAGKSVLEQYVKFAEMAIKEGLQLDEADVEEIETYLNGIESAAAEYEETFEQYMEAHLGPDMSRERVKKAVEVYKLAYKYYQKIYNETEYTDEQVEAEYQSNIPEYSIVDYYEAYITALYDETNTDGEIEEAKKAAAEKAEKIKTAVEGGKSFVDAYNEVLPPDEGKEPKTESDLIRTGVAKAAEQDKLKFMYEENADGRINIYTDENGNVSVILCAKAPYKDTTKTVNVRHILLDSSKYSTEDAAKAKAEELVAQITGSEDPKATFLSLVAENSADTASIAAGGLYEDISPDDNMVPEFLEWCFEEGRKEGDVGYILTDYGYHVMYLDSFAGEVWHLKCETTLRDNDFEKRSNDIYDSVKITYNEQLLDGIVK